MVLSGPLLFEESSEPQPTNQSRAVVCIFMMSLEFHLNPLQLQDHVFLFLHLHNQPYSFWRHSRVQDSLMTLRCSLRRMLQTTETYFTHTQGRNTGTLWKMIESVFFHQQNHSQRFCCGSLPCPLLFTLFEQNVRCGKQRLNHSNEEIKIYQHRKLMFSSPSSL